MIKFSCAKLLVSVLLVVWWIVGPKYGFSGFDGLSGHLLYPLSHANVWHLSANVLCLWMIPCDLHLLSGYLVSVACSFLPCFIGEPTCGFSGVLFAIVGMSWGRVRSFKDMLWRNKWWLVIPIFIPHVNALLHVYCLLAGYCVGRIGALGKLGRVGRDWL